MRIKRSAQKARQRRDRSRRNAARLSQGLRSLRCEPLESRVLLDSSGLLPGDPLPPIEAGAISGQVWVDADGNREKGANEVGLGGVTVFSDLDFNGVHEPHEPSAVTLFDDPTTDFDEGGRYTLEGLQPGYHNVRQVTPNGYEQTYPSLPDGYIPPPWGDASVHVVLVNAGESLEGVDFGNQQLPLGSISGVKWHDTNGNGHQDRREPGLAGVTIFADLNNDGFFNRGEPSTVTSADIPETDFDESGLYTLSGLEPGDYVIREVVPDGFRQTFPATDVSPQLPADGGDVFSDEFATIDPGRIDLELPGGGGFVEEVSVTIHPSIFVPMEIDVIVSSPDVTVINLAGPQTNGGTGDTSLFQLLIVSDGSKFEGELQFFDSGFAFDAAPFAAIPFTINADISNSDGSHHVALAAGESVEGIDFGNQQIAPPVDGTVIGRKWADLDGDGQRDRNEPGLAGVTIYADLNHNGVLDFNEPSTVTSEDIPETDFDETGLYDLSLAPGDYWIAEVVPEGYEQTFPNNPVIAIFPPAPGGGVHFVTVVSGQTIDGLNFGNKPVESGSVSGRKWADYNGNAERDPSEPGLGGVEIYADYNFNGQHDLGEPITTTMDDIPETDFDEAGLYHLDTRAGFQAIREIVPDGHFQTYPISDAASPLEQGAHFVTVNPGENIDGLDFGNQPIDAFPGSVSGTKWEDLNANAQRDGNEPGLGGVTIYSDTNRNGVFDRNEPYAVTSFDDPSTDFDEGGHYVIDGLEPGLHILREVVPRGFIQTFPISIALSPLESAVHFVNLLPASQVDGLDFGNYRSEVPPVFEGDFDQNGSVDHDDLAVWQESYGGDGSGVTPGNSEPMSGSGFLTWQRNLGMAGGAVIATDDAPIATATAPVETLPTSDLTGLSQLQVALPEDDEIEADDESESNFSEQADTQWRNFALASLALAEADEEDSEPITWTEDSSRSETEAIDAVLESGF